MVFDPIYRITRKTDGNFGIRWCFVKGRKLEFDGVPFVLLGTPMYDCQQGKDKNNALKMRSKKEKKMLKHAYTNRLSNLLAKLDKQKHCTA